MGPELERENLNTLLKNANLSWHGTRLHQPDWNDHSHSLALTLALADESLLFHVIFNAYWEALEFELPSLGKPDERCWRRWIDTSLDSPDDIVEWQNAPAVKEPAYQAGARSVVVVIA